MKPEHIYPYTRENPDLIGYAAVAAGAMVGFFAVVFIARLSSAATDSVAAGIQQAGGNT